MALPRQVLTISSQVAAGPVGNSAIVPALLAMGITPIAVPTILLSNHPGHGPPEGLAVPAAKLSAMLERLMALGFLQDDVVVLTGYFASADQIDAVAAIIARLPKSFFLCDPVLGDSHTGLYVPETVASALRDRLVPLADGLTPNSFELGWLTGADVHDMASARKACGPLVAKSVVVTSVPQHGKLTTALFEDDRVVAVTRPKLDAVPHGTGDLLSSLLAGRLALGHSLSNSLSCSIAAVEYVIAASGGTTSLDLSSGLKYIASLKAFDTTHE